MVLWYWKLSYFGHVCFETVQPDTLHNALLYLKENNSLYNDIAIVLGKIREKLLPLSDNYIKKSEKIDTLEEDGNPLDFYRFSSLESMFLSNALALEEIDIAPLERKLPKPILSDDFCEELAYFPIPNHWRKIWIQNLQAGKT